MNTSDTRAGTQNGNSGTGQPGQDFQHLKEDVTEALGSVRQQADAQFGQYRDTAADQIEALAQGAKSFVSEVEDKDTLGMSNYLADMAESMSGLAGNLRGKSAEQLLHDGAELARNNPGLFVAGSIALGFGLSRFLKAGRAATVLDDPDETAGSSTPPTGGYGASRPYETSAASQTDVHPQMLSDSTQVSANGQVHPADVAGSSTPVSPNVKGEW